MKYKHHQSGVGFGQRRCQTCIDLFKSIQLTQERQNARHIFTGERYGKKIVVRKRTTARKEAPAQEIPVVQPSATPKKRTTRKAGTASAISPEERHHLVAVAAYFIAERRSSADNSPHDDWLQAEQEIDAMIAAGKIAG